MNPCSFFILEYYQLTFEVNEGVEREVLIANLSALGCTGFEERSSQLLTYLPVDERPLAEVISSLNIGDLRYSVEVIKETNWNAEWESNFSPVTINDPKSGLPAIHIRAEFHESIPSIPYEILITPKMSFGTGHHATTAMMMEQMLQINFVGKKVFDFGTGTAVLAILAEKLGAAEILATDNDEWSILNAKENVSNNGSSKITIELMDSVPGNLDTDIILANINLNVIRGNLMPLLQTIKPGGYLFFSGFLTTDLEILSRDFKSKGIEILSKNEKAGWLNIVGLARK